MKRNVTIKDIAREAGVSIATVSYVLNNREEEKISEATRKKVLQIVNLLNYTSNSNAQALATGRSRNLAICMNNVDFSLHKSEQLYLLEVLSKLLSRNKYRLIYQHGSVIERLDNIDAIILFDTTREFFYAIGDKNFIPLVALDTIIDDPLFFQIISDYEKIKNDASVYFQSQDFTFVSLSHINTETEQKIRSVFDKAIFVNDFSEVNRLSARADNYVIVNHSLYSALNNTGSNIFFRPVMTEEKLLELLKCIELAIDRVEITVHNIKV